MKLKILEIVKTYPDYKPEGKSYTIFSRGCKADIGQGSEFIKINTFTQNIKIEAGAEFETGVNCSDIRIDERDKNGVKYKDATIKSLKKEFRPNQRPQITITDYQQKVELAQTMARKIAGPDAPAELVWSYFSAILKGMDNVNVNGIEQKKEQQQAIPNFEEAHPFDDSNIPF